MSLAAGKDAGSAPSVSCNIASHLPAMARAQPNRPAVIMPAGKGYVQLTFAELDARSDAISRGLTSIGLTRGTRTVLMVKPSLDFFALVFALFKIGAVLALIDPAIGRKRLLRCLDELEPEAFIGIPAAHVARLLFPKPFRKVRTLVTVGPKLGWGGCRLDELVDLGGPGAYEIADTSPDELAAILFTSGSTGIPKGALYTHGIFDAQVRLIRDTYGIEPGEIDLPTFPLFALFDPALGMTAVIPDMDARFPAKADPVKLLRAIDDHGCTNMFGSPALLDNLSRHCERTGRKLPTLRRVLSAGAPVRNDVLHRTAGLLAPGRQVFTPFGATESLPVASIGSDEVLADTCHGTACGKGICVGRPVAEMQVRIIRISDEPIERWSDDLELPRGQIGEIAVRGPVVTAGYFARPEQNRLAKIREGDAIVHRMGDLGWFDEQGRLWMCGRKSHRVETAQGTLFSVPCEEIFNQHPAVLRSALVGVKGEAVLLVERERSSDIPDAQLLRELETLGKDLGIARYLVHPKPFPVDVRHNAKIEREKLAIWAASTLA